MAANSFQTEWETPEFATIAELGANLVYQLPGCDDTTVRFALREAYAEFCRLSNALVTTRRIQLNFSDAVYPIANVTPDCRVECVRKVSIPGWRRLREGAEYQVLRGISPLLSINWSLLPAKGSEECFVDVECLEMPKSGSERVPRWFIRKHGDAICAGALVRLFSMTGKGWSDPAQARIELGKWEGYVANARLGSMAGSSFGNGQFDAVDMSEVL